MKCLERYYVAYGSNLNVDEMRYRCPMAELVGTTEMKGYSLVFKGANGNAYLTIDKDENGSVPVALWKVTSYDKEMLDAYEGYPKLYHIKNVEVDGMPCFVYIMNQGYNYELPTMSYYKRCEDGYEHNGLDKAILEQALKRTISKGVIEYV